MSNLGKKSIKIPSGLKVTEKNNSVTITGDFGTLQYPLDSNFTLDILDNKILRLLPKRTRNLKGLKRIKSLWGTQYSLLNNYIIGLSRGYQKKLDLVGVGFRANITGNILTLKLGFSHDITFQVPSDVIIHCPKADKITLFGISKQRVNAVVNLIQSFKKVDPYKGKGILIENTQIRLKEGKKK